jgi:lysylphosphatidylglycerol synthetase-like protein (DUF2156 family)
MSLATVIDHPSGFLALSARNDRFGLPDRPGFIAYREAGKHLVAFGGVHAAAPDRAPLLDAFLALADARGRRVVAVQVRESQGDLFRSRGFTVNRFGASYGLSLAGWSLGGGRKVKLRNKVKRARAAGLRVVEVGRDLPSDAATFARLGEIGAAWLRAKKKKEIDFMIGELGGPGDPDRRIFAAADDRGDLVAYVTYVPVWGARPGWLHDLSRRLPEAPAGAMELCNATAIDTLRAEGARFLHFGFTPFLVDPDDAPGASPVVSWVIRMLGRFGSFVYPARSQVEYKTKWLPDVVEPELVAFRPLSFRAIWDLLRVTRSI